MPGRATRRLPWLCALLAAAVSVPAFAQEEIFSDGFESGDVSAWDAAVGAGLRALSAKPARARAHSS